MLKIVYLITSLPLLLFLKFNLRQPQFNFLDIGNNFIVLLCTIIITDIYVIIRLLRKDEKQISSFMFFILILTIFHLLFNIMIPILSKIENFVLLIGLVIFGILFLIIYIGFIYKIIKDYNKNGFNPFRKIERFSYVELIAKDMEKLNTYQKIKVLNNNIIIVNEAGVFEIVDFNKKGTLNGNINEDIWYFNNNKINNPFILKTNNSYLISNSNTYFNVNVKLVPRSKLYLVMDKHLNKRIYNKEQIDKIYNDIEVKYGSNKDKIY